MAIKFERVKPGMVLWTTYRRKMGNTTMSETRSRRVEVVAIDTARGWVEVRGDNGMRALSARELKKWSVTSPVKTCCSGVGRHKFGCVQADRPRAHGGA